MKKTFCVILMLCAVVFAVSAQSGTIQELTGDVELKPAGASAFTPARAGSAVAQDTIVSTGFKGTAIIAIGNSTVTVKPLTRLSLAEIQTTSGTENISMNLQAGRVRVDVNPPAGTKTNFTVQSPSATASVRGTSFDFDTVNLDVINGTVFFKGNKGAGVPVKEGSRSKVDNNGNAINPGNNFNDLQPAPPAGTGSTGGSSMPSPTSGAGTGSDNNDGTGGDVTIDIIY